MTDHARAIEAGARAYTTLREANIARQAEWDAGNAIDLAYRGNELAGEVGEACNVIKKLERERHGIRGSRTTVQQLAEELADIVICTDLIAMQAGIDLDQAVRDKFNATSEKVGLRTRFASGALVPASAGQPFDKIKAGLEEAVAVAKGEQPAASIYVHGHKYVPASAVAAERERCGAFLDERADRLLAKAKRTTSPSEKNAFGRGVELRQAAHAIRQLDTAPARGEYVVVPRGDLARTGTSAPETGTVIGALRAATKDGER
jgi:NTP pyrophosphatase (non-canonical NTP hydrolase)